MAVSMDILSNLPHVLLIADDPVRQQELDSALRSWGHATTLVDTGAALAWLNQSPLDGRIVLVDGRLHAREAIACCRSLRDQTAPACVHYLLILADADGQLLPEAFAVGATCLLMSDQDDALLRARLLPLCQRSKRQMQQQYHLQALTQSHQRMKQDLQELGQVQKFWLPNPKKTIAGIDSAWVYRPAFIVSGDHFNLMQLSETQVGFCMIDVMGHGIAAAMRSLEIARTLSTHPNESMLYEPATSDGQPRRVRSPSEVANLLNVSFKMTEASPIYCTLIYGVLDTASGKGSFVQAGHGGPVHITSTGVVSTLGHGGFPVGLIDEPGYEEIAFQMMPGDRLFLYSDGITESADASSRIYGEPRLLACLAGVSGSVSEQLQAVDNDIAQWVGAGPLDPHHDDVSMLMLAYRQPASGVAAVGVQDAAQAATMPAAGADALTGELLSADARPNDSIRTLIVSASSEAFASMLPILSARGLVIDLLPIDDVQLDHVELSQYQLILVSWSGDLKRQRALLQRASEVRQALPLYVIAFSGRHDTASGLEALSAGADDFLALPVSLAELQCRASAGRQWIARDRILREELRHQQAINEQIITDLKMIEAFQRSRFPKPGAIQGDIASGWLHSTTSYSPDQLGVSKLDDHHIAFFAMHSGVKSMLSLVAAWATSRLVSREIDGNILYDMSASADGSPRIRAPSEVIQELHGRFLGKPTAQFHCTITYGVLNTATGQGQLVHVGANPPLLVRANADVEMIAQPSVSLGHDELTTILNHDFVLGKGDTLFLYGAGLQAVAEQMHDSAVYTDLKQVFAACHAESTLQRSLKTLGRIVTKWRETGGDHGANADISVLVLQRSDMGSIMRTVLSASTLESAFLRQLPETLGVSGFARPRSGIKLSIPVVDLDLAFEAGKIAGEFALNHGLSSIDSYFVDVAVVEVATNVSRHGYAESAGALDIWLVEQDGGIVVRLMDQGNVIDAAIFEAARAYEFSDQFDDIDDVKEGGMGLPLIFKSMDAVHYESEQGSNSFFMFKRGDGHSSLIRER